jgi:hypothetical protein
MSQKKIIVRLFGGLGNQLFIYAAARRLAFNSNSTLVLDIVSGFKNDNLYKRKFQLNHFSIKGRYATKSEQFFPFPKLGRFILRFFNKFIPLNYKTFLVQSGVKFDDRLLNISPLNCLFIEGYWQSERYFKDIESIIREDFVIIPPKDVTNLNLASNISNSNSVSIHFRDFDKLSSKKNESNISFDYYIKAIKFFEDINPNVHYFVFSDNPDLAASVLLLPEDKVTFVINNFGDENSYADLWLMSLCKHFIIANSTFSWWGAWLSKNPNKIVVTPDVYLNLNDHVSAWGFDGLIPQEWIKF